MKKFWRLSASALALAAGLAACGGGGETGGGISGTGSRQGTLRVALTDAPACGYDAVHVTVDRVRVHQSSAAADGDAGWSEVVLQPGPRRIDLLTLANGVLDELGQTPLPAGTYTQARLVLAENGAAAPLANAVTPTGGSEIALDTPSAQQTGLKINLNLTVNPDQVADLVLDFDACKSVVKRGNSGRYNLKPVITAVPRLSDAGQRVVGYVDAALAGTASVSLQLAGAPVKATVPEADGRFVLYPVPAGSYDLVIAAEGRATTVVTGVPVVTTAWTTLNAAASAIVPPASPMRDVPGTVQPDTATVRALQTLGNGSAIEAAWAPVTLETGAFTFRLPQGAPQRAAYAAGASPAFGAWTTDSASAARYTLSAQSGGVTKTLDLDALAATLPAIAFIF